MLHILYFIAQHAKWLLSNFYLKMFGEISGSRSFSSVYSTFTVMHFKSAELFASSTFDIFSEKSNLWLLFGFGDGFGVSLVEWNLKKSSRNSSQIAIGFRHFWISLNYEVEERRKKILEEGAHLTRPQ